MANNYSDNTVLNSITNFLDDEKIDSLKAFSFVEFLNYSKTITPDEDNFKTYEDYLIKWNKTTNRNNDSFDTDIKNQYIELLRDVTLQFTTNEEKRYLSNLNLNEEEDIQIALPFYAKKIKNIILYYKSKRDTFQKELRISKNKGSVDSIKKFVKSKLIDLFTGDDITPNVISEFTLTELQENISVELEESYDIFNDYYDIDPSKEPEFYNASGLRETFFSSNTNYISSNEFLNLDQAIVDVINDKGITISELIQFSPIIDVNTVDDNLLQNTDYIDYKKTDRNNLKLLLHAELAKSLLGTDFYYLSTDTQGNVLSGELFESDNKVANLLNTYNPTSLTVESNNSFNERNIGSFFKPTKFSILKMEGGFDRSLTSIKNDSLYIFPDPNNYGNISGLTKTQYDNPFTFTLNNETYKNNSSSFGKRLPRKGTDNQGFFSYDTFQQKRTNYLNLSNFEYNISNFYNRGIVFESLNDIYGNQFIEYVDDLSFIDDKVTIDVTNNKQIFTGSNTLTTFANSQDKKTFLQKSDSFKNTFCYNVSTNVFEPLSSSFNSIFSKFKNNLELYDELNNKILIFDIIGDIFYVKTKNYSVLDSYKYDGTFFNRNTLPFIIKYSDTSTPVGTLIKNVSNHILHEDKIFQTIVSLTPESSGSNNTFFYEFAFYDIGNRNVNFITDQLVTASSFFEDNFSLNLDVKVKEIRNIILSHDDKTNLFTLITNFIDLNENLYIHNFNFYIFNNGLKIVENSIYTPENFHQTSNFYSLTSLEDQYTLGSLSSTPTLSSIDGVVIL
jgi:hypothetical protein